MLPVPVANQKKLIWGLLVLVASAVVALWSMGYSLDLDRGTIVGPVTNSYDAEAEANSPECASFRERFPKKPMYTKEELDARVDAVKACRDAMHRYSQEKRRSRLN